MLRWKAGQIRGFAVVMVMVSYGNMDNDKCRGLLSISKGEEEQTKKIITLMCINCLNQA